MGMTCERWCVLKRTWSIGDTGYEVEWCSKIAIDEHGDHNPDQDELNEALFETRDEAYQFAHEIFPQEQYGSVRITPFRIEPLSETWPYGKSREYTGDSEYYEGSD